MRWRARMGRTIGAAALAGGGLLGAAAPAAAAGSDAVTVDHATSVTIRSSQSLSVDATAMATCKLGLDQRTVTVTMTGPIGNAPTTQTIASRSTSCRKDATLSSSVGSPRSNGTYVVTLQNGGSRTTSATLDVIVPPARGRGLAVTTSGTTATFTWTANPEPDVTAYQIMSPSAGYDTTAAAGSACSGSTCSTSRDFGPAVAGKTESFSVRAVRCGLSCSDEVDGAGSPAASATFSNPSPPSPSPGQPGSGGSNPGAGGSGAGGGAQGGTAPGGASGSGGHGGSTTGSAGHRGGAAGAQAGNLGGTAASPLPGLRTITKPLVLGKAGGTIAGPAPRLASRTSEKPGSATRAITHDISSGLRLPPLWRGVAAAVILLLIALHLRTWVARVDQVDLT